MDAAALGEQDRLRPLETGRGVTVTTDGAHLAAVCFGFYAGADSFCHEQLTPRPTFLLMGQDQGHAGSAYCPHSEPIARQQWAEITLMAPPAPGWPTVAAPTRSGNALLASWAVDSPADGSSPGHVDGPCDIDLLPLTSAEGCVSADRGA